MLKHGRGHSHPVWPEATQAANKARLDTGSDGRKTRPRQKLPGRRGAGQEEYLSRQPRNHRKGFRAVAFEAIGEDLSRRSRNRGRYLLVFSNTFSVVSGKTLGVSVQLVSGGEQ